MNMTTHDLKTWPAFYDAVCRGEKPFEVRKDDRGFQVGHKLRLMEFCPEKGDYTGRECECIVSYILRGGTFGIEAGFVVMGLSLPKNYTRSN
jgi:hypothetical protein